MTHTPIPALAMITIDTADVVTISDWWATVLGAAIETDLAPYFRALTAPALGGQMLGFQLVDEPTPGKNRIHLDLEVPEPERDAAVTRLVDLGATDLGQRGTPDGSVTWVTLADPDGNEFCIGGRRPE